MSPPSSGTKSTQSKISAQSRLCLLPASYWVFCKNVENNESMCDGSIKLAWVCRGYWGTLKTCKDEQYFQMLHLYIWYWIFTEAANNAVTDCFTGLHKWSATYWWKFFYTGWKNIESISQLVFTGRKDTRAYYAYITLHSSSISQTSYKSWLRRLLFTRQQSISNEYHLCITYTSIVFPPQFQQWKARNMQDLSFFRTVCL
jgi:hypothetical protein